MAKGKQDTARTWSKDEQHWVSMVLNLSHREGSFGVTSNRITIRVHCLTLYFLRQQAGKMARNSYLIDESTLEAIIFQTMIAQHADLIVPGKLVQH